ncbi:MAG: serine/threonine-protein kinase [Planctomycetota bacterium]|nr:serine/threonine-protein kinase [Planctomycetota bacterium]
MLQPGDQIGEFELIAEIGRGAMGAVWEARQPSLSRTVAIKFLKTELADATWMTRFESEAAQAARLSHPGILPVYAFGRHGDTPWFAMERVHGKDLADRLKDDGPMAPEAAARIARDAARALHHAHEHGIVHRDVKPANILLREDGRVAVTDFGLSMELGSNALTTTGLLVGTPYYLSPEAIAGKREKVGPKADVYALGVTLYELLAGHPPFQADNALALINQISNDEPPRLRTLRAEVPDALDVLVRRAMAKDPNDRPASAAALADGLDQFLSGESTPAPAPVVAPPPRPKPAPVAVTPRPAPPAARAPAAPAPERKPPLALIAAVAVVVLGAALFVLWPDGKSPEPDGPEEADPAVIRVEGLAAADGKQTRQIDRAFFEEALRAARRIHGVSPSRPVSAATWVRWTGTEPIAIEVRTTPRATVEVLQLPDGRTWEPLASHTPQPGVYRFRATAPNRVSTIWTAMIPPAMDARFEIELPPASPETEGMQYYAGYWSVPIGDPGTPVLRRQKLMRPYLLDLRAVSMGDYGTWMQTLSGAEKERMRPDMGAARGGRGRGGRRPAKPALKNRGDPMRMLNAERVEAYAQAQGKRLPTERELVHAYFTATLVSKLAKEGGASQVELVMRLAGHEDIVPTGRPGGWVRSVGGKPEVVAAEPTRGARGKAVPNEATLRLARDAK